MTHDCFISSYIFPLCSTAILPFFLIRVNYLSRSPAYTFFLAIEHSTFYYTNHNNVSLHGLQTFNNTYGILLWNNNSSNNRRFSLRPVIYVFPEAWPLQQYQVWVPSQETGLKFNKGIRLQTQSE